MTDFNKKLENFIISRIKELVQFGWSYKAIAEALGVSEEFVEKAANAKTG